MYCGSPIPDSLSLNLLWLCGGNSSRMGYDKAQAKLQGYNSNFLDCAIDLSTQLSIETYFSIRSDQQLQYQHKVPLNRCIVDGTFSNGPLNGIASAYNFSSYVDWLIIPIDMPLLTIECVQTLINQYTEDHLEADVFAYEMPSGFIQPFPSIYTKEALHKLFWLLTSNSLEKNSCKEAMDVLHTKTYKIAFEDEKCFLNFNSPSDLQSF